MRSISLLMVLSVACTHHPAPNAASSAPTSVPAESLYQPLDPQDLSKGFQISFGAAQALLVNRIQADRACENRVLDQEQQTEECTAQLRAETPTWWGTYGRVILWSLGSLIIGGGIGYGVGSIKR